MPTCGIFPTKDDGAACSKEEDQSDYRGSINVTEDGYECQAWYAQAPHTHSNTPENRPNAGLESNYCRNPDGEPRAWCYTTSSSKRWQFCNVPTCAGTSTGRQRGLRGERAKFK